MEMMVVIAMIVFIAAVTLTGVSQYIQRTREMTYKTNAHAALLDEQDRIVDGYLTSTRARPGSETTDNELHHDSESSTNGHYYGGGGGGGGGGESIAEPSAEPTTTPPTEDTTTEVVPSEPEATEAPAAGGGVTNARAYVTYGTPGNGVISIDDNSDGSQTVKLLYDQWNDGTVKLTRNADGSYTIQMTSGNSYFLGAVIGYNHDFSNGFRLTDSDKTNLSNTYGLNFS